MTVNLMTSVIGSRNARKCLESGIREDDELSDDSKYSSESAESEVRESKGNGSSPYMRYLALSSIIGIFLCKL